MKRLNVLFEELPNTTITYDSIYEGAIYVIIPSAPDLSYGDTGTTKDLTIKKLMKAYEFTIITGSLSRSNVPGSVTQASRPQSSKFLWKTSSMTNVQRRVIS